MLPFPIVYANRYELNLGQHVFPAEKYRLIYEQLLSRGLAEVGDFVPPAPAADEDVLLVHTRDWVSGLRNGTVSDQEQLRLEVPYSRELVEGFWLSAGGSILASRLAVERGAAMNLCGGFHHAFPDHGEGFCVINDVAIAIRRMQKDKLAERVLVIDLDVHQGNGTAFIFARNPNVFTVSLHQLNNYPAWKPPSSIDVDLEDGTGDSEYLRLLRRALAKALASFQPDLMCYLAGADPYCQDQLGGLALTIEGLARRDRVVFRAAHERHVPLMATLAGGYARRLADTIEIHINTVLALRDRLSGTDESRDCEELAYE
jgi:acetoin utilization deacetylase AcuC-like enzyme